MNSFHGAVILALAFTVNLLLCSHFLNISLSVIFTPIVHVFGSIALNCSCYGFIKETRYLVMSNTTAYVMECIGCFKELENLQLLLCGHQYCLNCLDIFKKRKGWIQCRVCKSFHKVPLNGINGFEKKKVTYFFISWDLKWKFASCML